MTLRAAWRRSMLTLRASGQRGRRCTGCSLAERALPEGLPDLVPARSGTGMEAPETGPRAQHRGPGSPRVDLMPRGPGGRGGGHGAGALRGRGKASLLSENRPTYLPTCEEQGTGAQRGRQAPGTIGGKCVDRWAEAARGAGRSRPGAGRTRGTRRHPPTQPAGELAAASMGIRGSAGRPRRLTRRGMTTERAFWRSGFPVCPPPRGAARARRSIRPFLCGRALSALAAWRTGPRLDRTRLCRRPSWRFSSSTRRPGCSLCRPSRKRPPGHKTSTPCRTPA